MTTPRICWMVLCAAALSSWVLGEQKKEPCKVDKENLPHQIPACAVEPRQDGEYVPVKYLKKSKFNQYGLTDLYLDPGGWMYVNRKGRVVILNVAPGENSAIEFNHGLVILERDEKFGYADANGRIVIPIRYDGAAYSDEDPLPMVCTGCRIEHEDEHRLIQGGQWFTVDQSGDLHSIPTPSWATGGMEHPSR